MSRTQWLRSASAVLTLGVATAVFAHGDAGQGHAGKPPKKEQTAWGIAGEARQVRRTIEIDMSDQMRFSPDRFEVALGETLRLRIRNAGKQLHELVIGTEKDLKEHAELMKKHPGMEHDEPYMAHVAAGKTGEIIWRFNRAGDFLYGCLIPGHWDAGMLGRIRVVKK
jgi:uncharacterized cupredoxin-like copper-binding protein